MPKKWKEVGGFKESTPIDIKEEAGQITEGIYDGYKEHVGENDSMVHYIIIDGEVCSFWGSTVLDARLISVEKGSEVRITYKGKGKSKTPGRKGFHDFKIEVAEGEDDEEEAPAPKVTKPAKKTAPKTQEDTEEGDDDEGGDVPF